MVLGIPHFKKRFSENWGCFDFMFLDKENVGTLALNQLWSRR